jgi:DUF2075 family protein
MIKGNINAALAGPVKEIRSLSSKQAVSQLCNGLNQMGSDVSSKQKAAWHGSWPHIKSVLSHLPDDVWAVFEYRLPMSNQRIDLLLLGRNNRDLLQAVIVELKGWRRIKELDDGSVEADGEWHQHPDIQTQDYVAKLRFTHSEAQRFHLSGVAWLYNCEDGSPLKFQYVKPFYGPAYNELANHLRGILHQGLQREEVETFLEGTYIQSAKLLEAIEKNKDILEKGAIEALCARGFAPSEEQQNILAEILSSVRRGEKKVYLVGGAPGSGKTYVAVMLLIKVLSEYQAMGKNYQNIAALGFRNNRLLNTVRQVFERVSPGLDAAVKFFSTGHGSGLAEQIGASPFKLVIYDEAQRMGKGHIENAVKRGIVTVFFFDEGQRLNAEEGGTREAFLAAAQRAGRPLRELRLEGAYRVQGGKVYHDFVEGLLTNPQKLVLASPFPSYDFRVFGDIKEMLTALREKAKQNHHVALVAAFTESPGDHQYMTAKNIKNLRIGHPLLSGFDHYKGKNLEIYWLMDAKTQYPAFWYKKQSNELTHCASIYGCQGFEADYVGVVWGRDLVWRNGQWELGPNCEDTIGDPSLKELFKKRDRESALPLLVNRYRIFLTRGIHGAYVYCEDAETAQQLQEIGKKVRSDK